MATYTDISVTELEATGQSYVTTTALLSDTTVPIVDRFTKSAKILVPRFAAQGVMEMSNKVATYGIGAATAYILQLTLPANSDPAGTLVSALL